MRNSLKAAVVLMALAVTLAGCGSGGAEPEPNPEPTASPSAGPVGSASPSPAGGGPAAPSASPSAWSSGPVSVTRTPSGQPRLVAIRSARNVEGAVSYDRLVLEFTGGRPGFTARYVEQVNRPGSGAPLPLTGQAFFELVVSPAAAHDDAGASTLRTPSSGGGLPALKAYAMAGDFEGYVHIGIGLDDVVGFRVTELSGPDRLVIDFIG